MDSIFLWSKAEHISMDSILPGSQTEQVFMDLLFLWFQSEQISKCCPNFENPVFCKQVYLYKYFCASLEALVVSALVMNFRALIRETQEN